MIQVTVSEARNSIKDMKGFPIILHFDDKIVQEFSKGRKLSRDRITVSFV